MLGDYVRRIKSRFESIYFCEQLLSKKGAMKKKIYGNPTNDEILEDRLHSAASQISLNINKYSSD